MKSNHFVKPMAEAMSCIDYVEAKNGARKRTNISEIIQDYMKTRKSNGKAKTLFCRIVLLLVLYACIVQVSCTMLNANNEVPTGTKKIVETRHYKAIKQGKEWVCGEEIVDGKHCEHTIIYYDQYGNELLKNSITKDGSIWLEEKRYYYDAKDGKLSKFVEVYGRLDKEEEYIRDNEGKLMQIKKSQGDNVDFEYDHQGRWIKEVEGDKTTYIKHYEEGAIYSKYDKNCKYTSEGEKGLVERVIVFLDERGKTDKEVCISYKYGYIDAIAETKWEYNEAGTCVSIFETTWKKTGLYVTIPSSVGLLDQEGSEKYIKETYYDKDPFLYKLETRHSVYNDYGDIISDVSYNYNHGEDGVTPKIVLYVALEIGLYQGFGDASARPGFKSAYSYVYNENGDYVKCVVSRSFSDVETASVIMRRITYF